MKKVLQNGPVDIGAVIQRGVVFDFKNWQGGTADAAHLPQAVAHLFDLLEKRTVDFVLVGGVALLRHVEGRNTQAILLIVDARVLEELAGLEVTVRDEYFARARFGGLRVDFLLTRHPLFRRVHEKYSAICDFQDRRIRCATTEGLRLLKLFSLPSLCRRGNLDVVGFREAELFMLPPRTTVPMDLRFEKLQAHRSDSDLSEVRKIAEEVRE